MRGLGYVLALLLTASRKTTVLRLLNDVQSFFDILRIAQWRRFKHKHGFIQSDWCIPLYGFVVYYLLRSHGTDNLTC